MRRFLLLAVAFSWQSPAGVAQTVPATAPAGLAQRPTMEVRLIRDTAQDIMVELLTLSTDGVLTSLARGPLPPDPMPAITIVGGADAWVRFSTPDRAPLTVRAADLPSPEGWRLPPLRAGSELFLTVEASALPPVFYQLSGPFLADIRVRDASATVHGLPSGTYELTPVYEGLVKGEPVSVTLTHAQTTAVFVKREAVGAVVLTARDDTCAMAETFVLAARLAMRKSLPVRGEIINTTDVATCRWRVGGLWPGIYEASLRTARGLAGRIEFRIAPDETTEAAIEVPAVTVSGLVSVNDKPRPNAMLMFQRPDSTVLAPVRPDGTYEIALDEDGRYDVSLRADGKTIVRRATFIRGANTLDFVIKDAAVATELTVRVSGADPSVKIDLDIRSTDGISVVSTSIPPGETTTIRRALAFGTHRVVALQPGATSELHVVEFSAEQLTAAVDLTLTRNARSITLRYSDGEPVVHASFSNVFSAPEEVAPGTYSLATVVAGTELVIKPPSGAPLCRIVHAQGDVQVVTDPGRSLILQFEDPRATPDNVRIATGLESACPVPLGRFLKTSVTAGPGRSRRVEVLNAPADPVLTIHTPDGAHQVMVPADGLVIVPAVR